MYLHNVLNQQEKNQAKIIELTNQINEIEKKIEEKITRWEYLENINQKISLRFPIERYKDFSVNAKGNWYAYYTDKFIEENSKPWKNKVDEWNKHIKEGLFTKDDADYKLAVLQYQDKIKEF